MAIRALFLITEIGNGIYFFGVMVMMRKPFATGYRYSNDHFSACISCGILWSKDTRNERKLNIHNSLIRSSLLYGSETWRLTENNKRRVEATELDAPRRSSRMSRKDRIRNIAITQQIGLEETITKRSNRNSSHGTAMFKEWQKEDCPE
jgi:hypothetical protein